MRSATLFFCIFLVLLGGCGGIGLAYEKKLVGVYGLAATDALEQMAFVQFEPSGSAIGVIGQTVFAAGWNDRFVILQRHPSEFRHSINKSITEYYVFSIEDKKTFGPFSETEFQTRRTLIGVPESLRFQLIFDSLK